MVRAKKYLGQHFLIDHSYCQKVVDAFNPQNKQIQAIEVGPGKGAITELLLARSDVELTALEVDRESIDYLKEQYPDHKEKFIKADFLKTDLSSLVDKEEKNIGIIGNFPYNISTQILFKAYHQRAMVTEVVGMFQKEVAQRIVAGPGSKTYGILSVLLKAFYDIEYLFTLPPGAFSPPPKVDSAVIRLQRNQVERLDCDEALFFKVIKKSFNQRRKTLRKSLKTMRGDAMIPFDGQRPEQLSVVEFIELTNAIEQIQQ